MTDRVPAPSTEAAKSFLRWMADRELWHPIDGRRDVTTGYVVAIEEAARAEGRREAVELRDAARAYRIAVASWQRKHNDGAYLDGTMKAADRLDIAVAGLNASESPPTHHAGDGCQFDGDPIHDLEPMRDASESPPRWEDGEPFPMGDASESPPLRRGDAMPSGQIAEHDWTEPKCLRCGALWVHQDDYAGLGTPHPYESADASESGQPPEASDE